MWVEGGGLAEEGTEEGMEATQRRAASPNSGNPTASILNNCSFQDQDVIL